MTWNVDFEVGTATHPTGFALSFQVSRGQVVELTPRTTPPGLGAVEVVKLIREGRDAIERSVAQHDHTPPSSSDVVIRKRRKFSFET